MVTKQTATFKILNSNGKVHILSLTIVSGGKAKLRYLIRSSKSKIRT